MAKNKKTISFGLVSIPVELNTVIVNNDTSFNQLHKKCEHRIQYKKICSHCKTEVDSVDIVKAYQFAKDEYVTFTDKEVENMKLDSATDIEIVSFIKLDEVNPIYFEKCYYLTTKKNKAFNLLKEVLIKEKKVALIKTVINTKFYYGILRPDFNNMILNTLYFEEEINIDDSAINMFKFNKEEIEMASKLIKAMTGKFEPSKYKDEYQDNIKKAIELKINGKAIKKTKNIPKESVTDLMEALKKSLKEVTK